MPKKNRYWICPCCKACYNRMKKEGDQCRLGQCSTCGCDYKKGYVYPKKNWYNYRCKHRRARDKASDFKQDYYRKPRNLGGQVLRISPASHKAFTMMKGAKRVDSFERRANIFLQSIYKDLNNYESHQYIKYIDPVNYKIKQKQGGVAMIPSFKLVKIPQYNSLGLYCDIYTRSEFIKIFQIESGYSYCRSLINNKDYDLLETVVDVQS